MKLGASFKGEVFNKSDCWKRVAIEVLQWDVYHGLYWNRLFGQKRPLLIFRGTLSGKTKQTEEKRIIEIAIIYYK